VARHIVVVDFDGTLAPNAWPGWPDELYPGAYDALQRFRAQGFDVVVFTARISPYNIDLTRRDPIEQEYEINLLRVWLNTRGLDWVSIWTREGKPPMSVLIDDRAERFNPGAKAWGRMADKVLLRLAGEAPLHTFKEEVPA
jgi:hypothetical protein